MSYTLYDGMYCQEDPFSTLRIVRRVIDPIILNGVLELTAEEAISCIDKGLDGSPLKYAQRKLIYMGKEDDNPFTEILKYEIMFYEASDQGTLVYPFAGNNYKTPLRKAPELIPFGYWDNADPSDDPNFEQRKVEWERHLSNDDILDNSFKYTNENLYIYLRPYIYLAIEGDLESPMWNDILCHVKDRELTVEELVRGKR